MIEEIEFRNYRSLIGRSPPHDGPKAMLNVDDDITTIIGKNEAGKSNILKAIDTFRDREPLHRKDLSNYGDYDGVAHSEIEIVRCLLYEGVKVEQGAEETGSVNEETGTIEWLAGPYTQDDLVEIPATYSLDELSDREGEPLPVSSALATGRPEIIRYASGDHKITFLSEEDTGEVNNPECDIFPLDVEKFVERRREELSLLCDWFILNAADFDGFIDGFTSELDPNNRESENRSLHRGRVQNELEQISVQFQEAARGTTHAVGEVDEEITAISPSTIADDADRLLTRFTRVDAVDDPIAELPTVVNQMTIDLVDSDYDIREDTDDSILRGLFSLGNVNFEKYDSYESELLRDDLQSAVDKLSDQMNSFWEFNESRRDRRDETRTVSNSPYEFEYELDGPSMTLFLSEDGGTRVPLGERSDGMRWIITFLLTILAQPFSQSGGQRSLILLDDPGIHLHPEAEKLLYRAFYYVVTEAQVIYTTHSPALVDQQEPDHLRIAKHIDEDETRGTTVTNDIREARDDDSQIDVLSTAREALGWTLDDFLFHGESTILVEGPSDKQYLQLFNQSFSFTEEKSFIDGDPTFIDSGGDKVTFLSRILEAEDVKHVILRDDDKAGEEHDRRIEERSIYYKDILDGSHEQDYDVEVEDLINSRLIITCAAEQHPDHLDTRALLEDYNEDRPIIDFIDSRLPDEIEVDKGELSRAVVFELREDIRESTGEYEETTERFHLVISRLADEFNT